MYINKRFFLKILLGSSIFILFFKKDYFQKNSEIVLKKDKSFLWVLNKDDI